MHLPHVQIFRVTAVSYFRVTEVTYFTCEEKYQNGSVQFIQTGLSVALSIQAKLYYPLQEHFFPLVSFLDIRPLTQCLLQKDTTKPFLSYETNMQKILSLDSVILHSSYHCFHSAKICQAFAKAPRQHNNITITFAERSQKDLLHWNSQLAGTSMSKFF